MKKYKFHWLFSFLVISIIFSIIFKVTQISMQSTLYDPLTYEAVNKAWEVGLGHANTGELKAPFLIKINVENNLQSFMTVYDKDKKPISSSGQLDGDIPNLPTEFLDNTHPYVRNHFKWTPKENVHLAGVTVAIGNDGYVLAGRNMQEAFRQGNRAIKTVIIGWAASAAVMTAGFLVISHRKK